MICFQNYFNLFLQLLNLGGLGVRPSSFFNNAALAKLAWRVISDNENWWSQIVRRKYLNKVSFFQANKKQNKSYAWNGVLDARDLVTKGMRWLDENGKKIQFWTFNWAFDCPLLNFIPQSARNTINLNELVADYIQNDTWNKIKLSESLDQELVKAIIGIPLSVNDQEDEVVWGPASDGRFSIRSVT